jgi:hypothetical protein
MSPLEDTYDVYVEYPVEIETLVMIRALNMHVKVDDLEDWKENIFHTKCHVQNKLYSLIIDGSSCTNITSIELIEKLNLHTTKHHILYNLQWLNDNDEVMVNK